MAQAKKVSTKDLIISVIGIALMFGFGPIVGEFETVTQVGSNMLGVFFGVILMTVFTSQTFLACTAGLLAMIWGGYLTADGAIQGWLGNSTTAGVIFIGALAYALQKSGLMDVLVKKFISIPALQHKPKTFLYCLLVMDYFVAMFVSFIPMCILSYSMFESIRKIVGYEEKSQTSRFIMLGIYLSCMGSYALPFKGVTLVINRMANTTMQNYGLTMSSLSFWITSVMVYIVFLGVYVLLLEPFFKCDLLPLKNLNVDEVEMLKKIPDKMTKKQVIILVGFIVGVAYLVLCNVAPATGIWPKVTFMGGFLGFLAILAVLNMIVIDGEQVVNATQCLMNGAMWGILIVVGVFTYLGNAMAAADLGIRAYIIKLLTPLFGGMGLFPLCFICVLVVVVATNFCNGLPLVLASYAGVLPFVCQLAVEHGISASVIATMINLSANMAFLTYAGTITSSLLLSRPEIDQKWVWTQGVKAVPVYIICNFAVCMVLAYVLPW